MPTPRETVRALASGQGSGTLAVPLALHVSARIQERDAEDFVYDPTQLANALRDLIDAVDPDGVTVTAPEVLLADTASTEQLLASEQLKAAVEATRRLRASFGDRVALVASLPGPAAVAGPFAVDAVAAANIARFHQAVALSYPADRYGLTAVNVEPLNAPVTTVGVTVTDNVLTRDTDIGVLRDWVSAVRG